MRTLTILLLIVLFAAAIAGQWALDMLPPTVSMKDIAIVLMAALIASSLWSLVVDVFGLFKKKHEPDQAEHH